MIQASIALIDEQLDAEPHSATKGTIRQTLLHLVSSQRGYLALLTLPVEERQKVPLAFADLKEVAESSGEGRCFPCSRARKANSPGTGFRPRMATT